MHFGVQLAHRDLTPMNRVYLFNADARLMLRTGVINPKDGVPFHSQLAGVFGEDGMKDFTELKGIEVQEKSKILTPQGT